ncbi:MAG: hypothetical protein KGI33_05030 [Thaumarchaeota archaeon]|nr:hypothetical protein [Nitrososphaerota archaeon]
MVDAVHARGWHYISESKPNRWAWYEGNRVKLDGMRLLVRHMFSDHYIEGNLYSCFQKEVHVESLGDISLVMKERLFQKGPDVMHFLVSDTMGIGADEVVLEYDRRHRIEEFYRDGKQSLGLGEYMVRDSRASNRHWRWVFLAYTLLVLVRDAEGLVEKTIGQMCDWIREKCAEVLVSRACTMARRSPETKQIVQALL